MLSVDSINRLEKDNEKLKKEVDVLINTCCDLIKIINKSANKASKYEECLDEIKEIASPHCTQCKEILQKINEVE